MPWWWHISITRVGKEAMALKRRKLSWPGWNWNCMFQLSPSVTYQAWKIGKRTSSLGNGTQDSAPFTLRYLKLFVQGFGSSGIQVQHKFVPWTRILRHLQWMPCWLIGLFRLSGPFRCGTLIWYCLFYSLLHFLPILDTPLSIHGLLA